MSFRGKIRYQWEHRIPVPEKKEDRGQRLSVMIRVYLSINAVLRLLAKDSYFVRIDFDLTESLSYARQGSARVPTLLYPHLPR